MAVDRPTPARLASVPVPEDFTPRQAMALASLLERIEDGSWPYLASAFGRLSETAATWPPPTGKLLRFLVVELRRWAGAHDGGIWQGDRLDESGR